VPSTATKQEKIFQDVHYFVFHFFFLSPKLLVFAKPTYKTKNIKKKCQKNYTKNNRTTRNTNPNEKNIQTKSSTRNCNFNRSNMSKPAPHKSIILHTRPPFGFMANAIQSIDLLSAAFTYDFLRSVQFYSNSDFLFVSKLVFLIPLKTKKIPKSTNNKLLMQLRVLYNFNNKLNIIIVYMVCIFVPEQ